MKEAAKKVIVAVVAAVLAAAVWGALIAHARDRIDAGRGVTFLVVVHVHDRSGGGGPMRVIQEPTSGMMFAVFDEGGFRCSECFQPVPAAGGVVGRCPNHPSARVEAVQSVLTNPWDQHRPGLPTFRQLMTPNDPRHELWRRNYESNAKAIRQRATIRRGRDKGRDVSVWDLPRSPVVYVVGSGPSILNNASTLHGITNGVKIGVNDAVKYCTTLDYLVCVDGKWTIDGADPKVTAILATIATAGLCDQGWADVRWIRQNNAGPLSDVITRAWPGMFAYDERYNVMPAVFSLIAGVFKPAVIVMVGADCGFTLAQKHPGDWVKAERGHRYGLEFDPAGRPVVIDDVFAKHRETLAALCLFAAMEGVKVINATEGGVMRETMEITIAGRMTLKEASAVADQYVAAAGMAGK